LKDVNLTKELMIQYRKAKVLQDSAGKDNETPYNQRAQVDSILLLDSVSQRTCQCSSPIFAFNRQQSDLPKNTH
jgi:hypothetical protein